MRLSRRSRRLQRRRRRRSESLRHGTVRDARILHTNSWNAPIATRKLPFTHTFICLQTHANPCSNTRVGKLHVWRPWKVVSSTRGQFDKVECCGDPAEEYSFTISDFKLKFFTLPCEGYAPARCANCTGRSIRQLPAGRDSLAIRLATALCHELLYRKWSGQVRSFDNSNLEIGGQMLFPLKRRSAASILVDLDSPEMRLKCQKTGLSAVIISFSLERRSPRTC